MARRSRSYEEQMETLNEQIAKTEDKLNSLIAQREELAEKKRQEELQELYRMMQNHHLSIADIERMITQ
ncbi:MAG: hypothetical protein HFH24_07105 [Ruminococcus sp.]|nr:hypothetical protein [Ruminococcus sp.]